MDRGARRLGAGIGRCRGDIYGAAKQMCDMLARWTGVSDKRGGAIEKAPGDAVHSVGEGVWCRRGYVSEEDCGSDGEEQLSAMLGESEVLCNRRGHGESVSMAECSDTAGIRSAAYTAWDSDDRRGRVWRDRRRCIYGVARKEA